MLEAQGEVGKSLYPTTEPETTTAFSCPSGWEQLYDHCYLYVSNRLSWADAENDCISRGGHLISVHSPIEQGFIGGLVEFLTTWMGGSDRTTEVGILFF